jgi:two-component system, LytTR family, response regulator AlgR
VTLRTAHHAYVLDDALADLEQRLGEGFVRIHRNALVAKSAVRNLERRVMDSADSGRGDAAVETWAVRIAPLNEWLAVSRRQLAAVREALRR